MIASAICSAPGASIRKFTPKGRAVSDFTRSIAAGTSGGGIVAAARKPKAPALHAAAVSSGVATQPIPVWRMGWGMPSRSQIRVWRGEAMGGGGLLAAHLAVAQALRVDPLAEEPQLLVAGLARRGNARGDDEREPRLRDDLVDARPRMHR